MKRAWAAVAVAIAILVALWLRAGDPDAPENNAVHDHPARVETASSKHHTMPLATISGRVTRADNGTGIANAAVTFASTTVSPYDDPPLVVVAGGDGAWTAPILAGTYHVAATAEGFLPTVVESVVVAPGATVDTALVAGGSVATGVVTDLGGGPVENARVSVTLHGAVIQSITRDDGRYRLTLPDDTYYPRVHHEAYATASSVMIVAGPSTLDFVLIPAGTIRGRVVASETGQPVPGAEIETQGGIPGLESWASTVADDVGNFTLRNVGPGAIEITARGHGHASVRPTIVDLGIGQQVGDVQLRLERGFKVAGRITALDHGVPDVQIWIEPRHGQSVVAPAPTDGTGGFTIDGVVPGHYVLHANAPAGGWQAKKYELDVMDRDLSGLVVELAGAGAANVSGVTIAGRVDPPAVATLRLYAAEVTSDATGAFAFHDLRPRDDTLRATTADQRVGVLAISIGTVDQQDLVVRLVPGGRVTGKVVDDGGTAIAGVWVEATVVDHGSFTVRRRTTTSGDGRFEIAGLPTGKVRLIANDDPTLLENGFAAHPLELDLAVGARSEVTLAIAARLRELRGTVVDARGAPVQDAWVTAEGKAPSFTSATAPVATQADGSFAIGKLREGDYALVAYGPRGEARGAARARTGDQPVIRLASLGSLTGRVGGGGAPITSYDLRCDAAVTPIARHVVSAEGTFAVDHLAPGRYECSVDTPLGAAAGAVTLADGPAHLELRVLRAASITGTVVSLMTGAPLADVAVGLARPNERMTKTDAAGRYVLEQVPATGSVSFLRSSTFFDVPFEARENDRVELGIAKLPPLRTGPVGLLGFRSTADDLIASVEPGGPAALAGLLAGDRVVAIDGVSFADQRPGTAMQCLRAITTAGHPVQLGLARGVTVTVIPIPWHP